MSEFGVRLAVAAGSGRMIAAVAVRLRGRQGAALLRDRPMDPLAICIGTAGSLLPAARVARLHVTEVLRAE